MLDQWGPSDIGEFRSSWPVSPQTAAKKMSTIKTFFEFCLSNEWIARNLARLAKNQRGRDSAGSRSFSIRTIRAAIQFTGPALSLSELGYLC
jgi:site-specific recombinase XerD